MSETAVVVTVDAADRVVSKFRHSHTPGGGDGMPAHVTILYPFVASDDLDPAMVDGLRQALSGFESFAVSITRLDRFPGPPPVLYAAPEPARLFRQMTVALAARFGLPPYGGMHDDVVPHLTIAISDDDALLARVEAEVTRALPISAPVGSVDVWEHDPAGWRLLDRIALGA